MADAQARTDQKVQSLSEAMERLADAQARTDQKVQSLSEAMERLADAQARTDQKVQSLSEAQARTDQKVQSLSEAQARTEQKVETLEERMEAGFKSLSDQIAALGSRWGITNEGTFRATISGILANMEGIRVEAGEYGGRQVDVIIRDGEHVILEITSRMHSKDINKLYQSADDYLQRTGVDPRLMVATNYVSPKLMQRIMGLERPIEIFSYESDDRG